MSWKQPHPRHIPSPVEIKENEDKIRELNSKIAALSMELVELELDLANRRSFIAVFRQLPPEILCKIAAHCIELGESPNKLNRICGSMREAMNGMKKLWNKICLVPGRHLLDMGHDVRYKGYILCDNPDYLQVLLSRVLPLPFSVILYDICYISKLLAVIIPHSTSIVTLGVVGRGFKPTDIGRLNLARVQNLDLEVSNTALLRQICDLIDHPVSLVLRPRLRDVRSAVDHPFFARITSAVLEITEDIGDAPIPMPMMKHLALIGFPHLISNISAPNLESLRLKGHDTAASLHPHLIPNQIQSLTLERLSLWSRLDHPLQFPNLEDVTFCDVRTSKFLTQSRPVFMMPRLEKLTIDGIGINEWDSGDCGHLEILSHRECFGYIQLKQLTIRAMKFRFPKPRGLAECVDLEVLHLSDCLLHEGTLAWLSGKDDASIKVLPNLAHLYLDGCHGYGFDMRPLDFIANCNRYRPSLNVVVAV